MEGGAGDAPQVRGTLISLTFRTEMFTFRVSAGSSASSELPALTSTVLIESNEVRQKSGNSRSHDRRQNLAALAAASLSNHCSACIAGST